MENDVSIVIAGEAGQGIDTITEILTKVFKASGYNVFSCIEFMSRIRGGVNTSKIRISASEIHASNERIDFLFALTRDAIVHVQKNITADTLILYDDALKGLPLENYRNSALPVTSSAVKVGGKIFANVILAGTLFGLFSVEMGIIEEHVKKIFFGKPEDVVQKNIEAVKMGYELGKGCLAAQGITVNVQKDESVKEKLLVNGTAALSLGCIAGGCDFIAAYPMSPSTEVFIFLAKNADDFNIIVEQAEDEIAGMNMAIGAWYAGARALVNTSGGGFDLMTEGLSLAGIIESPLVIHLGQRPGPATGLPTRTEQADLNLALYAGHSEFPRIILAPGSFEDAFCLGRDAFNLADKYQVPVFVLTDQYVINSLGLCKPFDPEKVEVQDYIAKTDADYKRYKLTDDGISPRGIPGYGEGLVKVDSDEHDEAGYITEDFDVRVKMVDKRLRKLDSFKNEGYPPELFGAENYKTLVIGWGSTCGVIKEAVKLLNNPDLAFLYFKQVYPLPEGTLSYLERAEKCICVENNATGQFAALIRRETGFDVHQKVLKYNGLPFYVEELVERIGGLI